MPEHATAPSAVSSDAAGTVDGSPPPVLQAYAKLPAQDVDRARAFHRSALGRVSFENPTAPPHATQRDGITDFGAARAAWFKDSEGNLISLAEFAGGTPFRRAQG